MTMRGLGKILILFSLMVSALRNPTHGNAASTQPQTRNEQSDLHMICIQIGKRAEADITDMVPHRV